MVHVKHILDILLRFRYRNRGRGISKTHTFCIDSDDMQGAAISVVGNYGVGFHGYFCSIVMRIWRMLQGLLGLVTLDKKLPDFLFECLPLPAKEKTNELIKGNGPCGLG